MNKLFFHLSKWGNIEGAKYKSIIVLEPSNKGNILLNGISDFRRILKKIFDGIKINGKPVKVRLDRGGGFGAEFDNTKPIPKSIFTNKTLKNICRLLSEAAKKDSYGSDSNKRAINLAGKINILLKQPAILENFAALVGKGITARRLTSMANCAPKIAEAIGGGFNKNARSAIANLISRIRDDQIAEGAIEVLIEILKLKVVGRHVNPRTIEESFLGDGPITVKMLKEILDLTRKAPLVISPLVVFEDYQSVPPPLPLGAPKPAQVSVAPAASKSVPVPPLVIPPPLPLGAPKSVPVPHLFVPPPVALAAPKSAQASVASQSAQASVAPAASQSAPDSVSNSGDASHKFTKMVDRQRQAANKKGAGAVLKL